LGRHPVDARLVRRHARRRLPPSDRRQAPHPEAQHPAPRERIHRDRLDQGDHDPRRDGLSANLRIDERTRPLLHRRQVRTGADGEAMGRGLNIRAKSVPGPDEDVITMSVEAARACMAKVDLDPTEIGAIYVGSESHPYAVKPTATIVAEAISSAPVLTAADFE